MESILELKHINKSFGSLQVLRDVSLTVQRGELLAIVGPSGAGKTTLLQIAGTLDRPDSGSVLYSGEDVMRLRDRRLSAFRNSHIGFIFQFHRLLPEFSALENVMMPALIGGMPRRKARAKAAELLELLGLTDRADHRPAQMSGGECQRVAVARALINEPSVVLADEPTGALDSANRQEMQHLFTSLRDRLGQTFVLVTHSDELAAIADRVVTMADGQIRDEQPTCDDLTI
jgi:lipoprotein-releasing system ATP-binding protein